MLDNSDSPPSPSNPNHVSASLFDIQEKNEISMTISAPGKVILYGEHSVVYGRLALAASLGLRTKAFLTETEVKDDQPSYVKVELPDINLVHVYELKDIQHSLLAPVLPLTKSPSNYNWTKPNIISYDELLHIIVDYVTRSSGSFPLTRQQNLSLCSLFYILTGIFACVKVDLRPFTLRVETELSVSSGSGSSASYSVVLAAAFIHYLRLLVNKNEDVSKSGYKSSKMLHVDLKQFNDKELEVISKWAYLSEKIMHGAPSGIDNTVCTYGALVEFRKMSGTKLVKFNNRLKLLLIDTNIKRDTKRLVNSVLALKERHSTIIHSIFEAMEEVAQSGLNCLTSLNNHATKQLEIESCFHKLGELMDINQHLLQALGVSHPTLDKICSTVKRFNLNAKLTGAGGGGYAIALIPAYVSKTTIDQLVEALNAEGFQTTLTDLGGPGVSIDFCNMIQDYL